MNREFWRDRRVLVTGHTGFKGAWLSLWLQSMAAKVTGFALAPPTEPSFFDLACVGQPMDSFLGDVRDTRVLQSVVEASQPEIVFHLAAQALVRRGYREPAATFEVNVQGTCNVLEALRTSSVRVIIVVTSDKCYRVSGKSYPLRETDELGGDCPYSSSKACTELVAEAYRKAYFSRPAEPPFLATARAGNVIGGGDWAPDRLIPDVVRAIASGQILQIRNPTAVRPWQHVLEPLMGYMTLAEKIWTHGQEFAEAWNFGPTEADCLPVQDILDRMGRLWPRNIQWRFDTIAALPESHTLKLDSSKAQQRLGWRPKWVLNEALKATVELYRLSMDAPSGIRMSALEQIRRFEAGVESTPVPSSEPPTLVS